VVIAIIAILAGILLPALARTKIRALSAVCSNNLKQLQLAWINYTDDENERMPVSISDALINQPGSWVLGNAQISAAATNITSGTLYPYTGGTAVYHRPADRSAIKNSETTMRIRSYTLDGWLGSRLIRHPLWGTLDWNFPAVKLRTTELTAPPPAGTFVFIDEHEESIDDGAWPSTKAVSSPAGPTDGWAALPSDRHSQGANLSFADGHVEHRGWKAPKHYKGILQVAGTPDDLMDLRYMQSVVPQ
jgi:prepilin-type processing-associated H-X9-DG protein